MLSRVTLRETTEKNVEKVKDCTNLYVSVWILEKTKTCKKCRFLFSKILIQNENEKILRFNRKQNQKSRALVCVSFEKRILICVCVFDSWTKSNLRFIISSFEWQVLCVFLGSTLNPLVKSTKLLKNNTAFALFRKTFCREKRRRLLQLQLLRKIIVSFLQLQRNLCF